MMSLEIKEHAIGTIKQISENEIPIIITIDKETQHYMIYDSYLDTEYVCDLLQHIAEEIKNNKINTLKKEKELLNE